MPPTSVVFYQESPGQTPVATWLRELQRTDPKAHSKCLAALERLAMFGHELRRPVADYLRDDIYELRVRSGRVNIRLLYFFHGRHVAVMAAALTKEGRVPLGDIERAIRRKQLFEQDPDGHTYPEDESHASHD